MLVCEAAGFDVVIVETVGVGQSETAAHGMTDMFVVLQLPNAGDDLQAIKKGVMEMADMVVINKADIDPLAADRAQAQIASSMRLLRQYAPAPQTDAAHGEAAHTAPAHEPSALPDAWQPQVLQISALRNQGIAAFWQAVEQYRAIQSANGQIAQRRQQQNLRWMWERIEAGLKQAFRQQAAVQAAFARYNAARAGRATGSIYGSAATVAAFWRGTGMQCAMCAQTNAKQSNF